MSEEKNKVGPKKPTAPKADFFADLKARSSSLQRIASGGTEALEKLEFLALDAILPNPHQPRRIVIAEHDSELAEDIKQHGVLQPIIVRAEPGKPDKYQLVAGSRRCRAAQVAGLTTIPALIKSYDDREARTIAAIENLQRADLSPFDEANYFKFLADEYNLSNRDIAKLISKSPGYVDQRMKILADGRQNFRELLNPKESAETSTKPWRYKAKEWQKFKLFVAQANAGWTEVNVYEQEHLRHTIHELKEALDTLERNIEEKFPTTS